MADLPLSAPLLLGGRYRLEAAEDGRPRLLGRGGMASVYLARDTRHGRQVAAKVLDPEVARLLGTSRFLREIDIASRLTHPQILPLYDSGAEEPPGAPPLLWYVMPYVAGESLRQRIDREGPLPVGEAVRIARDVASALGYAHALGVIHRDVKPENILLEAGEAVVADFGIARVLTAAEADITSAGLVVGTPAYMSPEQSAPGQRVDGRSDVYSLGCVLYEMLAGEPPFTGPSAQAILARQLADPPRPLRTVRRTLPPGLQEIVERALAKVPGDRFATPAEMIEALDALDPRAGAAPRPPPGGSAPRLRAVLAAAASVGALLLVQLIPEQRPEEPAGAPAADAPDPSRIAVTYFQDRTAGGDLRHVADGLTEDLIDELSGVEGLHVVSPNGVRPFRDSPVPLDTLARRLGVGTMVEGSVDGTAEALRVAVRLIDARSGEQLYAARFERRPDVLALSEELAVEVARWLRTRLGVEVRLARNRAGASSARAWELVQRAEQMRHDAWGMLEAGDRRTAERYLLRSDALLVEAMRESPSWAAPPLARGWLAQRRAQLVRSAAPLVPDRRVADSAAEALRAGLGYAERALALGGREAEALELRGTLRYELWTLRAGGGADSLVSAAEGDLRRALELDPGLGGAWKTLSDLLQYTGRSAEADLAARRALEADAYLADAPAIHSRLLFASLANGRWQEARRWCAEGRRRYPGDPRFAECELVVLGWSADRPAEAAEAWGYLRRIEAEDTAGSLEPTRAVRRLWVAAVLARAGMGESARAVIGQARALARDTLELGGLAYQEAYVRVLLGDDAGAIRLLDAYFRLEPQARAQAATSPWFARLRDDPRFRTVVSEPREARR